MDDHQGRHYGIHSIKSKRGSDLLKDESSDTDSDTPSEPDTPVEKINKVQPEDITIKTCILTLIGYASRYLFAMKDTVFLLLLLTMHHLFQECGVLFCIVIYAICRSIEFGKKDTKQVNKIKREFNAQEKKEAFKKLDFADRKKLKLRKVIKELEQKRKPRHLRQDVADPEKEWSEEEIFLKDYPTDPKAPVKYYLEGDVEGVPVTWEVDSASPITIISSDLWDQIPNKERFPQLENPHRYTDFGGHTVKIRGKYKLSLKLGRRCNMIQDTYVVEHSDTTRPHALLGADCTRAKRLDILHDQDSPTTYLSFPHGKTRKKIEFQPSLDCYVTNTISISGGETRLVNMSLVRDINQVNIENPTEVENTHGIVFCSKKADYIIPKQSLCALDSQAGFMLPITNPLHGNLTLFEGETLGQFNTLPKGTIIQTTDNIVEEIGQDHKTLPDITNAILQLSPENLKERVELYPSISEQSLETPLFIIKKPEKTTEPNPESQIAIKKKESYFEIQITPPSMINSSIFWRKVFVNIHKKAKQAQEIRLDFSSLPPTMANKIQIAFSDHYPDERTKVILIHRDLKVNRITLTNNIDSESETMSEDDLAPDLFSKKRIEEPKAVWSKVLESVPNNLRKRVFYTLTEKYPNVVSKNGTDFGECSLEDSDFKIELTSKEPFHSKVYPLNEIYKAFLDESIQDMVKAGLLIEESSAYGTGCFIRARPSSDGNYRIRCIYDLRRLNSLTIRTHHPIPNIKFLLQRLNKKRFWALIDLKDSYQSIKLDPATRHVAAIVTASGQFVPTRMGYGFTNGKKTS